MLSAEQVLDKATDDGSLDSDDWPRTLDFVLAQLDQIVNDFPKPIVPSSDPLSTSSANSPSRPTNLISSQDSHTTDKENAPPATPPRPPVPAFPGTPSASQPEAHALPKETLHLYQSIRSTLSTNFAKNPPHTIQRLAELVLRPAQHYSFLPSYLRALDRVVSVSSPSTIFPLPLAVLPNSTGLLNGAAVTPPSSLGSDESLGGALLTPIPWLQNRQSELISESTEIVDGPNGAGRIETVSVMNGAGGTPAFTSSAPTTTTTATTSSSSQSIHSSHPEGESLPDTGPVTQGEILRQEQEAGIVLSNPHSMQPNRITVAQSEGGAAVDTVEGEEEVPHARGPDVIGIEDTGLQKPGGNRLDFEAAVGRRGLRSSKSPGVVDNDKTEDAEMKEDDKADDAKPDADEQEKVDEEMKDE
ncbi:hypothetical protein EJ04DRAFT_568680 [Polyplosphaeria fusca]|uniref:Protein phosphatase 4 core regulatory subunit R2 n=1 Tax=Polyplosphaeria fusca TaxID=682080 RepID=A0A9P4QRA3_9PLEO|nr:hypothetical protein EJ04DRAFT_568680 [Polyplosphaeria fusca]